jgi:ABC-type nitrate/sulfonate/bicarbonate transport system ATPase subunit
VTLLVEGVRKHFTHRGTTQDVLRDVDLEVQPGELVALIGHSGCGKSTLVRAIGGLLPVDSGRISLDGTPVSRPGPDRAMVFQHYSLLPRLTLLDNVRHAVRAARPAWSGAQADGAAQRYLEAVGLAAHAGKRPGQVSGGMQQRTAVARAFAVEPRALLLDEPFGALDALTRARLQAQLIDLWRSESDTEIVLMVTHGIDEAILLADRIVVMGNGPGPSVIDVIEVGLPRPRDRVSVIDEPAFRTVQARLLQLLMHDGGAEAA